MDNNERETGIDVLGIVPWGTHISMFYRTKTDLLDILVPYFNVGLENNEFCIWITSKPLTVEDAIQSLKGAVSSFDRYYENGQIEVLDYTQSYVKSGKFVPDDVLNYWQEKEAQALTRGFDGLRISGDTSWIFKCDWKSFTDYEEMIESMVQRMRLLAICTYPRDECDAADVIDVINNHEIVLDYREGKWISLEKIGSKHIAELLKSQVTLRELQTHIQSKREYEKKVLANHIHEDIAQVLTAIKMTLSMLLKDIIDNPNSAPEKIHTMTEIIDKSMRRVKEVHTDLRPSILNHLGLIEAIKWQSEIFQKRTGIKCEVSLGNNEVALDWERSIIIFRVLQELLANVQKHADAKRVAIEMRQEADNLELLVNDDGIGITKEQIIDTKSLGIIEIKERVYALGGEVEFIGIPGEGTAVKVVVPFKS